MTASKKEKPTKAITKTPKMPHPGGRPSLYNESLADIICREIANGKSLRTICKQDGMPDISTVFNWLGKDAKFVEQYTRATQERSEAMLEDILDISDDGTNDWMTIQGKRVTNREAIERSKLRVDTRKWYMSKMKPKKYGDRLDIDATIEHVVPILGGLSRKNDTVIDIKAEPADDLIED